MRLHKNALMVIKKIRNNKTMVSMNQDICFFINEDEASDRNYVNKSSWKGGRIQETQNPKTVIQ